MSGQQVECRHEDGPRLAVLDRTRDPAGSIFRPEGRCICDGERALWLPRRDATAGRIDRGYLGRVLQLTLLAPDIVEAILDERHATELGPPELMRPFPVDWPGQRAAFADAAHKEPPKGAPNRG